MESGRSGAKVQAVRRMAQWQIDVCREAGADGLPIEPDWSEDGQPRCDERCPFHDGKRREALGARPAWHCEPAVIEMARLLSSAAEAL